MSECVVRMEMPSNCERCPMCGTASAGNGMYKLWCMCGDIPANSQRKPEDCPILCQLPEGHGRLVDADELSKYWKCRIALMNSCSGKRGILESVEASTLKSCIEDIGNSKTIVPAERSET